MQKDAAQLAEAQTDSCRQEIPLERIFVEYKTVKRLCHGFTGVAAVPDITTGFRWVATQFTCKGHAWLLMSLCSGLQLWEPLIVQHAAGCSFLWLMEQQRFPCIFCRYRPMQRETVGRDLWWTPRQTDVPELFASSPFPGWWAAQRPINRRHKGGISIFSGTNLLL